MVFTEDQAKDLFGTHFPRESGFLVGGKRYCGFESRPIRISFNMSYLPSCTSVLTSECETFLQRIKSANTNRNAVIEGPRVLQVPRPFLSLPPSLVALCSKAAGNIAREDESDWILAVDRDGPRFYLRAPARLPAIARASVLRVAFKASKNRNLLGNARADSVRSPGRPTPFSFPDLKERDLPLDFFTTEGV